MSACSGKNRPVGISPYVAVVPSWLVGIVQSLRYILITGFGVENWFDRLVTPCRIYIHPVVFLRIVGNGIILVAHTLSVASVPALEHVEVKPLAVVEPAG